MRRVFRIPFFGTRHIRREVDDELSFHLAMRAEQLVASGMPRAAAEREAVRQFGDVAGVRENCVIMDESRERAMQRANMIEELRQDVGFAFRSLRRNAGFGAVVVGALPVPEPRALVAVGNTARVNSSSEGSPRTDLLSYPLYRDVRDRSHVFSDVLASGRSGQIDARIGAASAELEHPRGRFVSANYFSVLGIGAARGRVFDGTEDQARGASTVVVISDGYWTRRFRADPSAIGSTIVVDGTRLTIIGVTPPGFTGEIVGVATDLWLPLGMRDAIIPALPELDDRNRDWLLLLGRLEPGATLAQAE